MATIPIYPEYQFFTGVKIVLRISGQDEKSFIISKLGEHFKSLSIKEGTMGNGQQFTPGGSDGVSSGDVSLFDEDNAIFMALLTSKTTEGKQLENYIDITLNTYTGERTYDNCRIDEWSLGFSGGVPEITLKWQRMPNSGVVPSNSQYSYDSEALSILSKEGISSLSDFKLKFQAIFPNQKYQLKTEEIENNYALQTNMESGSGPVYRFSLLTQSDSNSVLRFILKEFCLASRVGEEFVDFQIIDGNTIRLYPYDKYINRILEEPKDAVRSLDNMVFVYNSSLTQPSTYKTPKGEKTAFVVDSINTSFNSKDIITANLQTQANSQNPNGNIVLTSRGRIVVPSGLPEALTDIIKQLSSLSMSQQLRVSITVYNFIHFYVLGTTTVYLLVFDHLGNMHPMSGDFRVEGYEYSIDRGGVVKSNVTLLAELSSNVDDFTTQFTQEVNTAPKEVMDTSVSVPQDDMSLNGSGINPNIPIKSGLDYS